MMRAARSFAMGTFQTGHRKNGTRVAGVGTEVTLMEALIVSAALAGSLGTAWMIQRAILMVCLKAIAPNRR